MKAVAIRECSSCGATNVHNRNHCLICMASLSVVQNKSDDNVDSLIRMDTSETRLCPECRQMIDSDASYCANCGATVEPKKPVGSERICPVCKEFVEPDSAYCSQCGRLLQ
ncbi:MAG: zinc ribbon domain-containing protein [Sedimentisphaerales bacterium]|nr:zinc ribbon domain-containing protein [Sedimentisphaerales bacterium]